jgi:hypothetical protein
MRCPVPCRQDAGTSHEVGCSTECCERRPCGPIGLSAATSTLRFLARPGGSTSCVVPRLLAKTGSSSPELCLLFRVRTAPNLPHARMRRAPSLGFASPSRHQLRRSTCERGSQPRPTFRPRCFAHPRRLPLSTTSWACFIPLPRPGFTFQGFHPAAWPARLVGEPCPPVVDHLRLPPTRVDGSSSAGLAFRALIRAAIRSVPPEGLVPTTPDPLLGFAPSGQLRAPWRSLRSSSARHLGFQVLRETLVAGVQRVDRCPT